MKWALIIISSGMALFGIVRRNNDQNGKKEQTKKSDSSFVVLELFTSEGCSSCPPADLLLPQLASIDQNVIPLSFHVDYWDRLGWKDRFSNAEFTIRQREYARQLKLESIYTPELVINGEYEVVGSDRRTAEGDIKKLLNQDSKVKLEIDEVKENKNKLSVECHLVGDWRGSDLLAAVVQKHAETNVGAGENGGKKLSHTNVVRAFIKQTAKEKLNFDIQLPGDLTENSWQLILYTQQVSGLRVTGAAVYSKP